MQEEPVLSLVLIMKLFGKLIKSGSMRKSLGILLIASSLILCIVIAGCTRGTNVACTNRETYCSADHCSAD